MPLIPPDRSNIRPRYLNPEWGDREDFGGPYDPTKDWKERFQEIREWITPSHPLENWDKPNPDAPEGLYDHILKADEKTRNYLLDAFGRAESAERSANIRREEFSDPRIHIRESELRKIPPGMDPITQEDRERLRREDEERVTGIGLKPPDPRWWLKNLAPRTPMAQAILDDIRFKDRPYPSIPIPESRFSWENLSEAQIANLRSLPALEAAHEVDPMRASPIELWERDISGMSQLVYGIADTDKGQAALEKIGEFMNSPIGKPGEGTRQMQEPGAQPLEPAPTYSDIVELIPEWLDQPWADLILGMSPAGLAQMAADVERAVTMGRKLVRYLHVPGRIPKRGMHSNQLINRLNAWADKGSFKKQELKWSGLIQALEAKDGPVTQDWVLDWLENNNLQLSVDVYEGSAAMHYSFMEGHPDKHGGGQNYRNVIIQWNREPRAGQKLTYDQWVDFQWRGNAPEDIPKDPTHPGYKNEYQAYQAYKDVEGPAGFYFDTFLKYHHPEKWAEIQALPDPDAAVDLLNIDPEWTDLYNTATREMREAVAQEPQHPESLFTTPAHFRGPPDVVASAIIDDFIVDGLKTMVIYEFQSDVVAEAKKSGIRIPTPELVSRAQTHLDALKNVLEADLFNHVDDLNASNRKWRMGHDPQNPSMTAPDELGVLNSGEIRDITSTGSRRVVRTVMTRWNDRKEALEDEVRRLDQMMVSLSHAPGIEMDNLMVQRGTAMRLSNEAAEEFEGWAETDRRLTVMQTGIDEAEETLELAQKGEWQAPKTWMDPTRDNEVFPFPTVQEIGAMRARREEIRQAGNTQGWTSEMEIEATNLDKQLNTIDDKIQRAPPEFPFMEGSTTWSQLAWKQILQMAIAEGYDQIAWSTGDLVNKRYQGHLARMVKTIDWEKTPTPDNPDALRLVITDNQNEVHTKRITTRTEAEGYLSGERAAAVFASDETTGQLTPDDMRTGGEAKRRLYDEQFQNEIQKILRPFKDPEGKSPKADRTRGIIPGKAANKTIADVPHYANWVKEIFEQLQGRRARRLNTQRNQAQSRLDSTRKVWDTEQARPGAATGEQMELPGTIRTREQYNAAHNNLTTQLGEAQAELDGWGEINLADSTPEDWAAQSASREKVDQLTRDLANLGPAPGTPTAAQALSHEYTWAHFFEDQDALQAGIPAGPGSGVRITAIESRVSRMRAAAAAEGVPTSLLDNRPGYESTFREWLINSDQYPEVEVEYYNYRRSPQDVADDLHINTTDANGDDLSDIDLWERIHDEEGELDFEVEYDTEAINEQEHELVSDAITQMEDDESTEWVEWREENPRHPTDGPMLPSARKPFRQWVIEEHGDILSSDQLDDLVPQGELAGSPRHQRLIETAEAEELEYLQGEFAEEYLQSYLQSDDDTPATPHLSPYEQGMDPAQRVQYNRDQRTVTDSESSLRDIAGGTDVSEERLTSMGYMEEPENLIHSLFQQSGEPEPYAVGEVRYLLEDDYYDKFKQAHRSAFMGYGAQGIREAGLLTHPDRLDIPPDVMRRYIETGDNRVAWGASVWDPLVDGPRLTYATEAEAIQASSPKLHRITITPAMKAKGDPSAMAKDPTMGLDLFSILPPIFASAPIAAQILTPKPSHDIEQDPPTLSPLVR